MSAIEIPTAVHEISGNTYIKYRGTDAHVTVPEGITVIGDSAFAGCTFLKSVTLPQGVTEIGPSAFEGCYRLRHIDLPDSVAIIRFAAFEGCASLERITIPAGITAIEKWTFKDCTALTSIALPHTVTEISNSAFRDCSELKDLIIPEGVLTIGESTFRGCTALITISIPDSVKSIGKLAFRDCIRLESVSIHERTLIGEDVFGGCLDLTVEKRSDTPKKTAPPKNSGTKRKAILDDWLIIDGVLCNYSGNEASIEIPHGVTSVSSFAFGNRPDLRTVAVPETVIEIDDGCFKGCPALTEAVVTKHSYAEAYFTALGIPCRYVESAAADNHAAEDAENTIEELRLDLEETERLRREAEEAERLQREAAEAEHKRRKAEEERLQREAEEAEHIRREAEEAQARKEAEEVERLRKEAEEAEQLLSDPKEAERLRKEAEQREYEAEQARRKRRESDALRKKYDKLYDEIARQDYIIATNGGLFGQSARNRKEAEKRRAVLQKQLNAEFPKGRPK